MSTLTHEGVETPRATFSPLVLVLREKLEILYFQ